MRDPSMYQIDMFEIMFKMTVKYINSLVLKTLLWQQSMKCLPLGNDCEDTYIIENHDCLTDFDTK